MKFDELILYTSEEKSLTQLFMALLFLVYDSEIIVGDFYGSHRWNNMPVKQKKQVQRVSESQSPEKSTSQ